MPDSKILLVGGTGYLGRHLQQSLLVDGYDVYITGTKENSSKNYYRIDFDDDQSFKTLKGNRFDVVIVLASKLNAMSTTNLSHSDLKTNTLGYAAFLDFVAAEKVTEKVIYTSSMTVYGKANKLPVKEDGLLAPVHTYGLSKLIAEQLTSFFCMHNKITAVALRLPGIYGGDRKAGFVYNVADKCSKNEQVVLKSEGLIFWETINVDDLCCMILRFVKAYSWQLSFDVFNIGYGEETDFYQTAYTIRQLLSSHSEIEEQGEKGYNPFYLSNEKIKSIISIKESFNSSLQKYVEGLAQ